MTIVHKYGNIQKNSDFFSRLELPNTSENSAYDPASAKPQIPLEGIKITDVGTALFEEVRGRYKQDNNSHIINSILEKDCKDTALDNSLDDIWKKSYDNGRYHLFDGILYHRSKHTFVMVLCSRILINTILLECHHNIYSGHLSEDRTIERIKTCAWWPSWRKDVIEYFHSCDRCQKANKYTGKRFGLMINIHESTSPWVVGHIHWVTALPTGGEKSYHACFAIVDRYIKNSIFLPCYKDYTVRNNKNKSITYSFEYTNKKWDKSHRTPEFKVKDLPLVSTLHFDNIKDPKKLNDSFTGPFIIKYLHETNSVEVKLSGELENKQSNFPVSLVKHYSSSDKELFPLRNETPLNVPPLDEIEEKKVLKVIKERRLRVKNEIEYLVRYRNPQHQDEWLSESKMNDHQKFLRRLRNERRPIPQ
ncbi:hypothetical protein O181_001103 [Austropuccinia psidii MF-1]|uniref:Integrase zinc-binding domain-containing protein n=1 Tax=Austropuccinia psidii MF-1 TaxID=1389203 RepID=A0A9Q3B9V0_9BASI|nr:hypothetical protein [Austropuccinia psidii MF-1]